MRSTRLFPFAHGWRVLAAVALYAGAMAAAALAELQVVEEPTEGGGNRTVYRMTVTPAAEATPALRYRLLPAAADMRPGNAALFYTRAFAEGGVSRAWKLITDKYGDDVHGDDVHSAWYSIETPLADLPIDNLRDASARFDTIVQQFVARATVRRECDWGHEVHELKGVDIVSTLLPEIQESRSLSRALMLRTRAAVADRDYQRAIDHLTMNYRLAQNTAWGPFLISGLVGVAQASSGNAVLIELIAAKDSPNFYWALAEMPRPFIDMAPAVRYEMSLGNRMYPSLDDAERQQHSPEEWARLLTRGLVDSSPVFEMGPRDELQAQLAATAFSLMYYGPAKARLRASGMKGDQVEQMPVGQVIAVDAAREYRRLSDEMEKWWYVSLNEARRHSKDAEALLNPNKFTGGFGQLLASLLLPALSSAREAQTRLDWQLNAIQTVEAIRMHAAEAGKLPASLDDISCVPVPKNPITEKPYEYRLDGDTAIIELPLADGFPGGMAWRFEIKLAK